MSNKKRRILVAFFIVFSILYVIFAIKPLSRELCFIPVWTKNLENLWANQEDENFSDEKIPFVLGQTFGYFSPEGHIFLAQTFPFRVAISKDAWCTYGTNDFSMPIKNPDAKKIGEINARGFPFFLDDQKFVFLPGGSSFSKLDDEGKILWTFENYAPITAFSASKYVSVAGFSDGTISIFSHDGTLLENFSVGGSDFPVILGVSISDDANFVAAVSGQNRQRFVLAKKNENHFEMVFHKYLARDLKRQTLVKFDPKNSAVYYNFNGGLGVVDLKTFKSREIEIAGTILDVQGSKTNDFIYILSKNKNQDGQNEHTICVLEPFANILARFSFKSESLFISVKNNSLFIGRDSEISRFDVICE